MLVFIQAKQKHQIPPCFLEQPKKKSEVVEALGEVAKHLLGATAGIVPSARHSSTSVVASPAKSIDNRSKCYKQLGDLNDLRSSGVLT